jgi:DNA-directed RNA polymerase subunit RPC12/RpoP
MNKELSINRIIKDLKADLRQFPDKRTGKNTQFELEEAGMAAFSVFFTQCASFLEYQREMQTTKGHSNVQSLFELENIPSDNQIRNLLDPVSPENLEPTYQRIFLSLDRAGVLDRFRSYANYLLIAMDGTEYFSSQSIHCENCNHRILNNGKTSYFHSVITPVIVQAGNGHVISLEPEFILPQDGQEKQDCEIRAGQRWLEKHGSFYAKRGAILLGDDLYSRQPFCQNVIEKGFHFILVCKPDSHVMLYETVDFLAANGVLSTKSERKWNGKQGEIWTYRYANQLPLRGDEAAMNVNWCEITISCEDTGVQIYKNAWITDFNLSDTTVQAIVRDGRARWKVENENNNVLKTKGYHLEHNFGHGNQYLASLLLSFNLLAFLFHTILDLVDERYQAIRQALGKRRTFFQDLEALLRYFSFKTWEDVLEFMFNGLELNSG